MCGTFVVCRLAKFLEKDMEHLFREIHKTDTLAATQWCVSKFCLNPLSAQFAIAKGQLKQLD